MTVTERAALAFVLVLVLLDMARRILGVLP